MGHSSKECWQLGSRKMENAAVGTGRILHRVELYLYVFIYYMSKLYLYVYYTNLCYAINSYFDQKNHPYSICFKCLVDANI